MNIIIKIFRYFFKQSKPKELVRLYKYPQGFSNEEWKIVFGVDRPLDYDYYILIECGK